MFYAKSKKMKRLFVFVPAIFLVLFLLNSFVLKQKDAAKAGRNKTGLLNTVFRSADGGQTWQDIGDGLPENLRQDGIRGNNLFANDKGLFLRVGNGLFHSTPNAAAPFWTKEIFPDQHNSIALVKSGSPAGNYWGVNLKKTNGTSVWSPMFENFLEPRIRSVFESAGGSLFIGIDRGLFKTTDDGKTWTQVYAGGVLGNLAESNGILVAINMRKIMRSTDNGENWAPTISEDSVAFDVKQVKGGFAAITASSASNTRRLSMSYDDGKTWQLIDAGLYDKTIHDPIMQTWNDRPRIKASMSGVIQIGENFFCAYPDGIFRSSDKGKTWKLSLTSEQNKVFNIFVSGNVIYAIRSKGGC